MAAHTIVAVGSLAPQALPLQRRLLRLLHDGPLTWQLPLDKATTQQALLLLALSAATATQQAGAKQAFVETLKKNMCVFGLLDRLASLALSYFDAYLEVAGDAAGGAAAAGASAAAAGPGSKAAAGSGSSSVLAALPSASLLWHLHMCQSVLENATFTFQPGAERLASLRVAIGSSSGSTGAPAAAGTAAGTSAAGGAGAGAPPASLRPFAGLVAKHVAGLTPAVLAGAPHAKEAAHSALSVLMNMSHQNPKGSELIAGSGGLASAASLLHRVCCGGAAAAAVGSPFGMEAAAAGKPSSGGGAAAAGGRGAGAGGKGGISNRGGAIGAVGARCSAAAANGGAASREAVLAHVDLVNVAIGVLINLVTGFPGNRAAMLAWAPPLAGDSAAAPASASSSKAPSARTAGGAGAGSASAGGLVPLLCSVITAVAAQAEAPSRAAAGSAAAGAGASAAGRTPPPLPSNQRTLGGGGEPASPSGDPKGRSPLGNATPGSSTPGEELTEAALRVQQAEGVASIVEAYACVLLGFLVEGDEPLQRSAAAALPGGSLEPVVAQIRKCLQFYASTGAITEAAKASFVRLLAALTKQIAAAADADAAHAALALD